MNAIIKNILGVWNHYNLICIRGSTPLSPHKLKLFPHVHSGMASLLYEHTAYKYIPSENVWVYLNYYLDNFVIIITYLIFWISVINRLQYSSEIG